LFAALAGCAGGASVLPQAGGARAPQDNIGTVPGDNIGTVPGDNIGTVPGDNIGTVPGDNIGTVPGSALACGQTLSAGAANCTIAINTNVQAIANGTTPASLLPGLHPADLRNAYGLNAAATGGTVAIVDAYDDPTAEADLAVYRAAYGLPPCLSLTGCFKKVNQQGVAGSYPAANFGWDEEISLDLDVVSAVCPTCKIVLVEANSEQIDDLTAAVDRAATMNVTAISNSYYAPEWSNETAYDVHYNHPGIAITASAGDAAQPFYPAASPYVTSVGGTSLSGSSGAWSETPWAYGGQGCSAYETKPAWQGNNSCSGKRSTVDVAAVADPQTGVSMFDSLAGGFLVAGGTSVGAPLVAAAYALSGNPQGPAYSYAHRTAFNDVAPAGYDLATGLGSPKGVSGL
jgi:subtilase family serine protease